MKQSIRKPLLWRLILIATCACCIVVGLSGLVLHIVNPYTECVRTSTLLAVPGILFLAFAAVFWFCREKLTDGFLSEIVCGVFAFLIILETNFANCRRCTLTLTADVAALVVGIVFFIWNELHRKKADAKSAKADKKTAKAEPARQPAVEETPQKTPPVTAEISLKEAMAPASAKSEAALALNKKAVADFLENTYGAAVTVNETDLRRGEAQGKEAVVNVDTLGASFEDGAEITLAELQKKKLVPASAKRVKVLARGELTKNFTVIANSYSADAKKMIVARGGKLIRLKK